MAIKIFRFLSLLFWSRKKTDSKFITSSTEKHIITKLILPNISRTKGNQAAKFGQLIEYNVRNIFLEKWYVKYGKKVVPDFFSKIKFEHTSGPTVCVFTILYSLYSLYVQIGNYQNILNLKCWPLGFTSQKAFFF